MSNVLFAALVLVTALAIFAPAASAASTCPPYCPEGASGNGPTDASDPTQNPCRPTCATWRGG